MKIVAGIAGILACTIMLTLAGIPWFAAFPMVLVSVAVGAIL